MSRPSRLLLTILSAWLALNSHATHADTNGNLAPAAGANSATASQSAVKQNSSAADKKDLPPPPPSFISVVGEQSLSPDEIVELKKMMMKSNQAAAEPVGNPAKPWVGMIPIDLSPGATPPIVRLSPSQGASLVFVDINGDPYPILQATNFAPKLCDVKLPIDGGSILTIEPKSQFGIGNISIIMKDLTTPIVLTVLGGQSYADYRLDLRIPRSLSPSRYSAAEEQVLDADFQEIISGVVANSSLTELKTSQKSTRAWLKTQQKKKTLFLRTDGILLSPAPIEGRRAIASDKTRSYEIPVTPVIAISRNGEVHNISVEIPYE